MLWIWLHLLQCCVSNQSLDPDEDTSNKPWRPIPSGLISVSSARLLRWILLPLCLSVSVRLEAYWEGISLALACLVYNEFGFRTHLFMRDVCNAWGYASFNAGAYTITSGMCVLPLHLSTPTIVLNHPHFVLGEPTINARTAISFAINALINVSTIYAQDFRDEIGDLRIGRRTIPILWPEASRIGMVLVLAVWSIGLAWTCDLGPFSSVSFCALATFVGLRFFRKRTAEADRWSFHYYNVRQFLTQA